MKTSVFRKRNVELFTDENGYSIVRFYGVAIVEYNKLLPFVVLRAYNRDTPYGCEYSVTTKRHINDALHHFGVPLFVFQRNNQWYVNNLNTGDVVEFFNGSNFAF